MYYYQEQDESVYNLIPHPEPPVQKPPMYKSKHNPNVPPSYSTFGVTGTSKLQANCNGQDAELDESGSKHKMKKPAATMGKSVAREVSPQNFLRKNAHANETAPKVVKMEPAQPRRPAVPKRTEKPVMGLTTQKNFVVANAVDNILSMPKRQPKQDVSAVQRPDFGKTPTYLKRIKQELKDEQEYIEMMQKSQHNSNQSRMREMEQSEKDEMIARLKQKWETTHKQYLAMTFSLDTISKVQRKEALEAELEQLEKAIAKLSKKIIYVYDDTAQYY
eukprot:Sspe_Gene.93226::Locus_65920_Transcript_2_2_Confidence_0.500_Length_1063::g.93226::m.93226